MLRCGPHTLMWPLAVTPKTEQDSKKKVQLVGEEILFLFLIFLPWFITTHKSLNFPFSWFPIHLREFFRKTVKDIMNLIRWKTPLGAWHPLLVCPSFPIWLYWKLGHFCYSVSLIVVTIAAKLSNFSLAAILQGLSSENGTYTRYTTAVL